MIKTRTPRIFAVSEATHLGAVPQSRRRLCRQSSRNTSHPHPPPFKKSLYLVYFLTSLPTFVFPSRFFFLLFTFLLLTVFSFLLSYPVFIFIFVFLFHIFLLFLCHLHPLLLLSLPQCLILPPTPAPPPPVLQILQGDAKLGRSPAAVPLPTPRPASPQHRPRLDRRTSDFTRLVQLNFISPELVCRLPTSRLRRAAECL